LQNKSEYVIDNKVTNNVNDKNCQECKKLLTEALQLIEGAKNKVLKVKTK